MLQFITVANIGAIDLNLLVVLHILLEEQSATAAARKLHVTQSAVSNALARLRELLRDPLFVRHSRGLAPTPRALALRPQLSAMVRAAGAVLDLPERFDPATSTREFHLACADYCSMIVLPRLFELLQERAPHASMRVSSLEALTQGSSLARDIDLHIGMPPSVPKGCNFAPVFEDEFVCLTRRTSRTKPTRISMKEYLAASHVRVRVLDTPSDTIDRLLAERDQRRNIVLTVPHFSAVPHVVARSGCIATLSRRLAEAFSDPRLSIHPLPIAIPTRALRMIWHQRTESDEAAHFLRALVREAAS
ncbi:MAG TPA: LysR family transcriptional regulator [Polyangiales bacterium]|nr:LysR family transcriptional regulator [Polyangiales bacterium]